MILEVIAVGGLEVRVKESAVFCGRVVLTPEEPLVLKEDHYSKAEIEAAVRSLEGVDPGMVGALLEALDFG